MGSVHRDDVVFGGAESRTGHTVTGDGPSSPMGRTRLLLTCGWACPLMLVVFVVWAAAVTPGYSHVSNTVSQLAAQGQPHPEIMGTGFVVFGILATAFAFGVGLALLPSAGRMFAVVATVGLAVYGLAIAASGFVQDYPIGGPESGNTEGFLHSLFAQIAVVGLLVAMAVLFRAGVDQGRGGYAWFTAATGATIALSGLTFLFAPESIQGLLQRVLYLVTLVWLVFTALHLSSSLEPRTP